MFGCAQSSCYKLLLASVCPSVCPHGTVPLPPGGLSWNFMFGIIGKVCRQDKVWQNSGHFPWRHTNFCVMGLRSRECFLGGMKWCRRNTWRAESNKYDRLCYLCASSTGTEEIVHGPNITLKLLLKHGENLTCVKSSGKLNM